MFPTADLERVASERLFNFAAVIPDGNTTANVAVAQCRTAGVNLPLNVLRIRSAPARRDYAGNENDSIPVDITRQLQIALYDKNTVAGDVIKP